MPLSSLLFVVNLKWQPDKPMDLFRMTQLKENVILVGGINRYPTWHFYTPFPPLTLFLRLSEIFPLSRTIFTFSFATFQKGVHEENWSIFTPLAARDRESRWKNLRKKKQSEFRAVLTVSLGLKQMEG